MNLYIEPSRSEWAEIIKRPVFDYENLASTVASILNDIRENGDKALLKYEEKFDKAQLDSLKVSEEEFSEAEKLIDPALKQAIDTASGNIYKFHKSQLSDVKKVETMPGVCCWQKSLSIEKVGLYVPGGNAPLFSTVLMLAIPSSIAYCSPIILCTPPDKEGMINQSILSDAK